MKSKEKVDKWLEDEAFMSFAQKRTTEIARYLLNNYPYDLKYEAVSYTHLDVYKRQDQSLLEKKVEERIAQLEKRRKALKVTSLSFNTFYEY